MAGFNKWTNLVKASETGFKIARLLFDNHETINIQEWYMYWEHALEDGINFDAEDMLDVLMQIWLDMPPKEGHLNISYSSN